jgi:glycosyltransferase involved in cell wall biosynthesis
MLKQTLGCLKKQRYADSRYEIIVVDDGSTDGTKDYLEDLANRGRLQYIRQSNAGPARARNAGAALAKGKILAFTDDDCQPDDRWLSALDKAYASFQGYRIGGIGGRIENVGTGHLLHEYYRVQGSYHAEHKAQGLRFLDTANATFPRSVFLEIGGFNEQFDFPSGEDVEFGLRVLDAGYKLASISNAIVWHVGRTSIPSMLKQSLLRGYGAAYLSFSYASLFEPPESQGIRLTIRKMLDSWREISREAPLIIRPFVYGAATALHKAAHSLPIIEDFFRLHLPKQLTRYQAMGLSKKRAITYLVLEITNFVFRLLGRVAGGYRYAHKQAQADRRIR